MSWDKLITTVWWRLKRRTSVIEEVPVVRSELVSYGPDFCGSHKLRMLYSSNALRKCGERPDG